MEKIKKEELLSTNIRRAFGLKINCAPHDFIQELIHGEGSRDAVTIKDILNVEPSKIEPAIVKDFSSDRQRNIRKSLKLLHKKLSALGFTAKDGPFMKGSYFPTSWSPREELVTHWVTECGLTMKEANLLYELSRKAKINCAR